MGVVLFECLTGRSPWGPVDGIGELVAAILTAEVPNVQDLAPWVRPELAEVVHRALSRDPAHRLKSAAELRDSLRQLVTDPTLTQDDIDGPPEDVRSSRAPRVSMPDTIMIGATPRSGMPVVTTTAPTTPRSRLRPLAIALAASMVAGAGAWTLARGSVKNDAPIEVELVPRAASAAVAPPSPSVAAPPPASKTFVLEVSPANVAVTVDGAPASVVDGRVSLSGTVGTVRALKLTHAGRTTEQRVAITSEGLVPAKLAIARAIPSNGPRAERPKTSSLASSAPPAIPTPTVVPVSSAPRLSEQFE
jgi:serine/threonine-protein kinase